MQMEKSIIMGFPSNSNAGGTIGGQESQIKESVEANFTWVEYYLGYSVASQPNRGYYQYTGNEETVVIPKSINGDELTSYYKMFYSFYSTGDTVKKVVSQNENITSVSEMFEDSNVNSLDLSNFKTSNITDMSNMFYHANWLTDVNMSNWDTSKVTNMSNLFAGTGKLKNIDVSKWDTSNVIDMSYLFNNTVAELDVSNWNTSKVTNMISMFNGAKSSVINVSKWDVSNVSNHSMTSMFSNTNLEVLDLTSFGGEFTEAKSNTMFSASTLKGPTALQAVYVSDSTLAAALETKYAFPNVFKVKQ